jgi:hypothetical protein
MKKKKYHSSERAYDKRLGEVRSENRYHANMPTEVVMKEYPKMGYGLPEGYEDNIGGIDSKAMKDHTKIVSQMKGGDNDYRGG